jgi:hypothetical protein
VKLGKSVFGILPGDEGEILELFDSFEEVTYYNFIGYVLESDCQSIVDKTKSTAGQVVMKYGFISILLIAAQHNGRVLRSNLNDLGLDNDYVDSAVAYLNGYNLVNEEAGVVICTHQGLLFAQSLRNIFTRT